MVVAGTHKNLCLLAIHQFIGDGVLAFFHWSFCVQRGKKKQFLPARFQRVQTKSACLQAKIHHFRWYLRDGNRIGYGGTGTQTRLCCRLAPDFLTRLPSHDSEIEEQHATLGSGNLNA